MCSYACRNAISEICNCECQGVFHGVMSSRAPEEHEEKLLKRYPPCTPIRFKNPTMRGTTKGRVKKFHCTETGIFVQLQANNELVKLQDYEFGEKLNETNHENQE